MVTGVETAGIVLAVFPLCIELIKLYVSGAETLGKILRHHHRVLQQFQRELNMESCKFYNCLLDLFEDTLTEQDCVRFFQDPKEAEERLKARLDRPGVVGVFIDAVGALQEELDGLQGQFPVDKGVADKITGKNVQSGSKEYLRLCKRAGKDLKKRFKLAVLDAEYSDRMKRIRNINEDLDRLVNGARQCATNLSTSRAHLSAIENHYKLVRDTAQSICITLNQRIQAPHNCAYEHSVSLCLDMKNALAKRRGGRRHSHGMDIRRKSALNFRILFCLAEGKLEGVTSMPPVTWRELEVEPIFGSDADLEGEDTDSRHREGESHISGKSALVMRVGMPTKRVGFVTKVRNRYFGSAGQDSPSLTSTTTAYDNVGLDSHEQNNQDRSTGDWISNDGPQITDNFCMTIKSTMKTTERQSLGCLTSDCEKIKHRLWSLPIGGCFGLAGRLQCSEWLPNPVPLLALLQNHNSNGNGYPMMKLQHRLSLGIKLASSVVQLRQTPWLNDSWSNQDIVFFTDPHTRHPLIENPMLLHNFSAPQLGLNQQSPGIIRRSKLLFSLGVVLWELWFCRRLEDDEDLKPSLEHGQWSDKMLFVIAGMAFQKLDGDAPLKYCDAVRTCFFDNIPTESQGFSTIVWQKVICSLQETYYAYTHA